MNILFPADGSPYSRRVLAYLSAHPEWLGPHNQYTVLHVVSAVPPRAAAVLDKELLKGYYTDEAEKVFKPIRSFFKKQGLQPNFVSKVGNVAEVIAKQAEAAPYDLLILGSHGHSALGNLVMGSIATKVMSSCTAPVLLVR